MHTRRTFFGTIATLGALVLGCARTGAASAPVRMSLDAFAADPTRLASLRKAVAVMKARQPSDHRSWFFQAAVHAYGDALYADALKLDTAVAQVNHARYWNKCPHFGQSSADFLIWHRAYLHFFERILRDAAGDPTLAIPYWDYGSSSDRAFPSVFAPKFLDAAKTIENSLYHPNRELAFVSGRLELSSAIGEARAAVNTPTFFHTTEQPGFGGDHLEQGETQIGLIEQRPHDDVHVAVGGVVGTANGAMAEITTAAFDPVFWVHHANIDRMWAVWARVSGRSWGTLPPDTWFDETPYVFLDVDGSEQVLSRRQCLTLEAGYDCITASVPPLILPAPAPTVVGAAPGSVGSPAPPQETSGAARLLAGHRARAIMASAGAISVSATRSAKKSLAVTPAPGGPARLLTGGARKARAPSALTAPLLSTPGARVLLELSDISFARAPSSGFAVYLDSAGETRVQGEPIGLISLFGASHSHLTMAGMRNAGATQRFDVTRIVRGSAGPFTVRVEPYDLLVTHEGTAAAARPDKLQIGDVRFVVTS